MSGGGQDPAAGWLPDRAAVTVVIPTHDRLEFLREALASALRQGPSLQRVVVVDDGSSDGTARWLDGLDDPRVLVRHQRPAAGGAAARNLGLACCSTPYVLFLDDDDLLREGALDRLVGALRRRPDAVGAAGACHRFGATTEKARVLHPRLAMTGPVWREILFCWGMYPSALLWRTELVVDLGGWTESLRRFEDRDLVLRAGRRPFALIPDVVADLRVHPGQVTNVADEELDFQLRAEFAASLPPPDRAVADAVIAAARPFDQAMAAYRAGRFAPARAVLSGALRPATTLARSPILGPWLAGLALKANAFSAVPAPVVSTARTVLGNARAGLVGPRTVAGPGVYQNATR